MAHPNAGLTAFVGTEAVQRRNQVDAPAREAAEINELEITSAI